MSAVGEAVGWLAKSRSKGVWVGGLAVAGFAAILSIMMPFGGATGPGMVPLVGGCLLGVACVIELTRTSGATALRGVLVGAKSKTYNSRLVSVVAALFVYTALLTVLGFLLDTMALGVVFGLAAAGSTRSRVVVTLVSWALTFVIFILFSNVFVLVLPAGVLG